MGNGPWSIYQNPYSSSIFLGKSEGDREIFLQLYGNFDSKESRIEYAEMLIEMLNGCTINIRKVE